MSRLLLENSNKVASTGDPVAPLQTPAPIQPSQPSTVATDVFFGTPQRKSDLRRRLVDLPSHKQPGYIQRLLFRKVEKAFDQKDVKLA